MRKKTSNHYWQNPLRASVLLALMIGTGKADAAVQYVVTDLGLAGGLSINDSGQVVGFPQAGSGGMGNAVLWQNGAMTDLGTLAGDTFSRAFGINNAGQAVSISSTVLGTTDAFLWQNGSMVSLNTLLAAESQGWTLD